MRSKGNINRNTNIRRGESTKINSVKKKWKRVPFGFSLPVALTLERTLKKTAANLKCIATTKFGATE